MKNTIFTLFFLLTSRCADKLQRLSGRKPLRLAFLAFTACLSVSFSESTQASEVLPHTAGATPADRLQVMDGFQVELLYSANKDQEGSWIAMCVDSKGRLIVGNQYNEGLFRLTPPLLDRSEGTKVEKIPVDLSGTQGLLWAFDSLYAVVSQNAKHESGLYRVTDTNGDDQLDHVTQLKALEGKGDHGWHGVLLSPDGESLIVVAGNHTSAPPLRRSTVPPHWGEDHLLPRMSDARGHARGVLAPGGCLYRISPDGQEWEMFASGFRNTYDAAFHPSGDLFTFDSDMEWDMNTPWYRPTRVCFVASGAEFGWRNGSGKWPAEYLDSLPGVLDIGPGSPTGVEFGTGARFPARYQHALFLGDWSYGKIYAAHLEPEGAAYRGTSEVFISGAPLPTTDIVVNQFDGALYIITGGWNIQSGLYRVTFRGDQSTIAAPPSSEPNKPLRNLRRKLESLHGADAPESVMTIWPNLAHRDRFIRYAARVALEWQDSSVWRQRALHESDSATAIAALAALARVAGRGASPETRSELLRALSRIDWENLNDARRFDFLRTLSLVFVRLGPPDISERKRFRKILEPAFPSSTRGLNSELCQMLVYLQSPLIAFRAVAMLEQAVTQDEQMDYARALRVLRAGWTPELRERYFRWFLRASAYRGGASFKGFVEKIKSDAIGTLTENEREALANLIDAQPLYTSPLAAAGAEFIGRTESHEWTVDGLMEVANNSLSGRDFDRGRRMFAASGCFSCHRLAGDGGAVGPDLTGVGGRFSPRDLLESIVEPSKTISDLYGNVVLTDHDGESLTGRIVYLRDDSVQVCPNLFDPADTVTVDRKQIRSITPASASPMPEGLLSPLKSDEVMDLLAYLLSGGDSEHSLFRVAPHSPLQQRENVSPSSVPPR